MNHLLEHAAGPPQHVFGGFLATISHIKNSLAKPTYNVCHRDVYVQILFGNGSRTLSCKGIKYTCFKPCDKPLSEPMIDLVWWRIYVSRSLNKLNSLMYLHRQVSMAWNFIFIELVRYIQDIWISIKIFTEVVHKGSINNKWALVWIMDWRLTGDKPLSETMLTWYTHKCVSWPQGVKFIDVSASASPNGLKIYFHWTWLWLVRYILDS